MIKYRRKKVSKLLSIMAVVFAIAGLTGCSPERAMKNAEIKGRVKSVDIVKVDMKKEDMSTASEFGYAYGNIYIKFNTDGDDAMFVSNAYIKSISDKDHRFNSGNLGKGICFNILKDANGFYIEGHGFTNGTYEAEIQGYKYDTKKLPNSFFSQKNKDELLYYSVKTQFTVQGSYASHSEFMAKLKEYQAGKQALAEQTSQSNSSKANNSSTSNAIYNGFEVISKKADGDFIYLTVKNTRNTARSYVHFYVNQYSDEACTNLITQAFYSEKSIAANATITVKIPHFVTSKFWYKIDRIESSN